jgi:hypothetical protein
VVEESWRRLAMVVVARCGRRHLGGGGGGSGHTADLVSGETQLASLAPVRGARVPVGQPLRPIQICDVACTPTLVGIWPMV